MRNIIKKQLSSVVFSILLASISCFSPPISSSTFKSSSRLLMVPRYNRNEDKWEAMNENDKPEAGYGPIGSLIRAGPLPFIQRIINAEEYEQGVLKYMASEGCDRMEAQGNFDAYLENPNDWAYQKTQEKLGKPKKDYATANTSTKQIILSSIWACIVVWFLYEFLSDVFAGKWADANTDILHGNLFDFSSLGL